MCYSFFLFTYAHSLRFPRWNFNRSFEFPFELFSELSAVWKLWGGERIDPLLWTSLVPKAVTVHVSTWAGNGLLLAGKVHCQALFLGVWIPIWKEFGDCVQLSLSSSWVVLAQMPKGPVRVAASFHFLCAARAALAFQNGNALAFQKCSASIAQKLYTLSSPVFFETFWVLWANLSHLYMSVSYLEGIFISATIFLIPLKDHIVLFFFAQGLPFS